MRCGYRAGVPLQQPYTKYDTDNDEVCAAETTVKIALISEKYFKIPFSKFLLIFLLNFNLV